VGVRLPRAAHQHVAEVTAGVQAHHQVARGQRELVVHIPARVGVHEARPAISGQVDGAGHTLVVPVDAQRLLGAQRASERACEVTVPRAEIHDARDTSELLERHRRERLQLRLLPPLHVPLESVALGLAHVLECRAQG
jgi:hypothetical protein